MQKDQSSVVNRLLFAEHWLLHHDHYLVGKNTEFFAADRNHQPKNITYNRDYCNYALPEYFRTYKLYQKINLKT